MLKKFENFNKISKLTYIKLKLEVDEEEVQFVKSFKYLGK